MYPAVHRLRNRRQQKEVNTGHWTKLVPVGYAVLIFLGFINTSAYYMTFGIEIHNYLSVTEILFTLLYNVYPIVVIYLVVIFIFLLITSFEFLDIDLLLNTPIERIAKWLFYVFVVFIILFSAPYVYMTYQETGGLQKLTTYDGFSFFLFLIVTFSPVLFILHIVRTRPRWLTLQFGGILLLPVLFIFSFLTGLYRGNTKLRDDKNDISLVFDKENTFTTMGDEDLTHIGSTQNYIFIYNIETGESHTFQKDKILEIVEH